VWLLWLKGASKMESQNAKFDPVENIHFNHFLQMKK
jgi:hypothetical protein